MDGVDERVVGDAGVAHSLGVFRGELVGPQGQLLEEAECGAQLLVDGSGPPVTLDCLPDVVTERVRRDRGVGVRSEGALLEVRDPAGEELALAGRPVGLAAHRQLERVGERPPEDLRPVVERLQDAARLACRAARGSGRGRPGSPGCGRSRRRQASEAREALLEAVEAGVDRCGDGLLEDLVVGEAGVLQRLDVGVGDRVGLVPDLVEVGLELGGCGTLRLRRMRRSSISVS